MNLIKESFSWLLDVLRGPMPDVQPDPRRKVTNTDCACDCQTCKPDLNGDNPCIFAGCFHCKSCQCDCF